MSCAPPNVHIFHKYKRRLRSGASKYVLILVNVLGWLVSAAVIAGVSLLMSDVVA
jgi:hypothetical protein